MLILQAAFDGNALKVWGESPEGSFDSSLQIPPLSPFDPGDDVLRKSLAPFLLRDRKTEKPRATAIWLPTIAGKPLPSSPLIASAASGEPELTAWTVSAMTLSPAAAIDLLAQCVNHDTLAPGLVIGTSLKYWSAAMRFAGALAARDSYLPGLAEVGRDWRAVWRAYVTGPDSARFAQLAKAMPGSCRAMGTPKRAPSTPATAVLLDFLNYAIDALARLSPKRPIVAEKAESIHDRWVQALSRPDGRLSGDAAGWRELAAQIADWSRPLAESAAAAFRLCFRLEEPVKPKDPWWVRYLLQAHDDPSLLIDVEDAWQPEGIVADAFRRRQFSPKEYLLGALGQAARASVPVEQSLRKSMPAGYPTDVGGAYAFLTESAWMLEHAGFGVMLPTWWTGKKRSLTASAVVQNGMKAPNSDFSLDAIVQFNWRLALGDEPISAKELAQLAALKSPLVQFRGQWIHLSAEQIQAALAGMKKKERTTVRDLLLTSLGTARNAPGDVEVTGVEATGWVGELLTRLSSEGSYEQMAPPAAFTGQLRPYQVRGFSWLAFLRRWGLGACLADDMGLGKTIQTLALIRRAWEDSRRPTLLVCPTSVIGNWQREANRFVPDLPVHIHHGSNRPTGKAFEKVVKDAGLVLTSYALLYRDAELLQKVAWSNAVLDEAQNIKNPETKQSRAARSMNSGFRIALTGTPVENHVGDLWAIMDFLNPGLLGNQAEFRRRYFLPIQTRQDPDATARLRRATGPFILRRLKTDKSVISDLPEKVEMKVFCRLTKEQASLYQAAVDDATKPIESADGIARRGMILALLLRLKQICNHPAHYLADGSPLPKRSGKLNRLTELLEEIREAGERVLIFSQFTEMGEMLHRHVQETFGKEALFLHGAASRKRRDEMVHRFQSDDGPWAFVLSLKAGGTGLNLTNANHVIHFDRWWNPAVEDQATDRAFRIGQKRNVVVHKFICSGTLEERIDTTIDRKKDVAGRVVGSGEQWLTDLSNRELRDILTLSDDAVED